MTHLASPCFCLFFVFWTSACLGWRWWLGKCLRNVEGQAVISNCNPGTAQHSANITIIWWDFPVLSAKLSSSELGFHFSMTRLSVWQLDRMWWWLPKCLGGRYVSSGVGFVSTVSTPTLNTSHQSPDGASPASCETRPVEMKSPRRPALLVFLLVVEDSLGMGADQAYCRLSPQHTLCRWNYHLIQIQNLEFDQICDKSDLLQAPGSWIPMQQSWWSWTDGRWTKTGGAIIQEWDGRVGLGTWLFILITHQLSPF